MSTVIELEVQEQAALEQTAISVRDRAFTTEIVDQTSYNLAAMEFRAACDLEKKIKDYHSPLKQKAHETHRAICTAENELLAPVVEAKQTLSRLIGTWDAEQERVRQEEQRRLEEEARKRADEEALQSAVDAELAGADEEEVEAVLTTPGPITKVQAAPTYQKAAGVSTREVWSAEIVNIATLIKAAAENPSLAVYLTPNMPALNGTARAQKSMFRVPGVRATCERIAAGRGR